MLRMTYNILRGRYKLDILNLAILPQGTSHQS